MVMDMTFQDLRDTEKRKEIPAVPGIYIVKLPSDMSMVISDHTCAVEKYMKRGRETINQRDKAFLERIWNQLVSNGALADRVLYIGKSINLRKRLNEYQRVMFKNGTNHSGGVYVCQIADCSMLRVEWIEHHSEAAIKFMKLPIKERKLHHPYGKEVNMEIEAEEHQLISMYCGSHGGLRPFANRND